MSARRHRSHLAARALGALVLGVAIVVGVVVVIVKVTSHVTVPAAPPPPQQCVATAGDYEDSLTLEQAGNAAIITGVALQRGLPARAATIALVTAIQESWLQNLNYGDLDSLGLFQQRPSQGWGTPDEIMDPWYAAGKFYDALVKVPNWQTADIGDVAQAVQRSGVPDGYDPHESEGRAWASTLTGNTPAGVTCIDRGTAPGDPGVATALLQRVFGSAIRVQTDDKTVTVTASNPTTAWAVAQLSLANTDQAGVVSVQVGDQRLTLEANALATWATAPTVAAGATPSPDDEPLTDTQARIVLR